MEKIVRDYFPYITETETTTFTDCVKCLITFTSSKFSSDASLNAIAFLRFCAVKLAEEGFVCHDKETDQQTNILDSSDGNTALHKDYHVYFWVPLLAGMFLFSSQITWILLEQFGKHCICTNTIIFSRTQYHNPCLNFLSFSGLARLTTDSRPTIRKGALEVLFDILKDHGHLFSQSLWANIFESVIYPLFGSENFTPNGHNSSVNNTEDDSWNFETKMVALKCLADLYITFFEVMRPELSRVTSVVTNFIRSPYKQSASTGLSVFELLTEGLASKLCKDEWEKILLCFKESAAHTFVVFDRIVRIMQNIEIPDRNESYSEAEQYPDHAIYNDNEEEANMETASYAIVRMRSHISLQLLVVQVLVKSVLSNPGVVNLLHKFSLKYESELIIRKYESELIIRKRSLHALSLCQMLSYTYHILVSCRASLNCMRHTRALFVLSI
jgi:brefeldin A-inhibited guanine nucleotide-exchange protein